MKIMAFQEIQTVRFDNFVVSVLLLCLMLSIPGGALWADEVSLDQCVSVSTVDESSTLDRTTRVITSTAEVTIANTSDQPIKFPLYAVININGTDYQDVAMPDAQGGYGVGPYGKYYYEWEEATPGQIASNFGKEQCLDDCPDMDKDGDFDGIDLALALRGGRLAPGESLKFRIRFQRPAGTVFTYTIHCLGSLTSGNQRPVAEAGADQTIEIPLWQDHVFVSLDGSQSFDPDGEITSYVWTDVTGGSGNPVDPDDVAYPQIRLPVGTYTFRLVVQDNGGYASDPDTVKITVVQREFQPPEINVSPTSYRLNEGERLTVQVNATDNNGRDVRLSAYPLVKNATFTSTSGPTSEGTFIFTPDHSQQGLYTVAFKAINDLGLTSSKTITIEVDDINRAPVIDPVSPVTVDEGQSITIHINATDPDNDIVTVSAENLPANALFVPASNTFMFAPDYEQSGTYQIQFAASDGKASSAPVTLSVEVNDVEASGNNTEQNLELLVNPVESPTLNRMVTISGSVNSASGQVQPQSLSTSLITSLSPASVRRGQTIDIHITGMETGDFKTHFEDGVTTANFGEGIHVNSLNVVDAHSAVANITVDDSASVGQRSVALSTNRETAVSMVGFSVTGGNGFVSGTVLDQGSGTPLQGVLVSIQGTSFSTTTDSEGHFSFSGVPDGEWTVLINAPNHELRASSLTVTPGENIELGAIETRSLAFQSSDAPAVSLNSLLGRGLTAFDSINSLEDAEKIVRDAYLLVGGPDIGVLDEYGNQINPKVKGAPYTSVKHEGIRETAEGLITGETTTLGELLYSYTYLWEWDGSRPNLIEWLHAIQSAVDRAWEDPDAPESALFILLFNQGKNLSPEPPKIVADTPLNSLQAQLMSVTLLVTAGKTVDPAWLNQQILERSSE